MRGAVVYSTTEDRAKAVRSILETRYGFAFSILKYDAVDKVSLRDLEYIAAEWDLKDKLLVPLMTAAEQLKIAFYNETFIVDIDESSELERVLQDALKDRNYRLCKSINDFYRFGDIIRKRSVLRTMPKDLQIETTDLCNAKCIMCSHAYNTGSGVNIMESGLIEKIEPILPFVSTIILHGNGEPLIVKNLGSYLNRLSEYGVKFITNTNLSYVSDDIIKLLNEDFLELNISCDGYDKTTYEYVRRGLDFDVFTVNCKKVRERCPDLKMKMAVVIMRQNLEYLHKITEFAYELGFDEVVFNQLCTDERLGNAEDDPFLYKEEYIRAIRKTRKTAERLGISVKTPDLSFEQNENDKLNTIDRPAFTFYGICDWLVEKAFINLRGDLAICCINQNYIAGNVFEQSVKEIWNCDRYRELREEFYAGRIIPVCAGCDFILQNRLKFMHVENDINYKQLKKNHR